MKKEATLHKLLHMTILYMGLLSSPGVAVVPLPFNNISFKVDEDESNTDRVKVWR